MNAFFELPWTPSYTQSGTSSTNGDSPLAYWSLAATVAFTVFVYAFEGSLDARQKAAYQKTKFPSELDATVSKIDAEREKKTEKKDSKEEPKPLLEQLQAKFKSSQIYGLDKINFGMFASTYDTLESVAFLLLGFLPYAWDKSLELGKVWFGYSGEDEIKISLIFLALVTVVGTITSLPFELYSTFNIEKKHGFNKQTYGLFFTDKIKSLVLTFLIGGPFIALLLKIIKVGLATVELSSISTSPNIYTSFCAKDGWRILLHLRLGIHVCLLGLYDDHRSCFHHAFVQQI
jgi:STE24 endopeptidase